MHLPPRQPHQILKCRALAGQRRARVGPVELAQERRRIEDALRRTLRPLAFHEPDQEHFVEFAVPRGLRVEQLHTRMTGARRERLPFDPSSNHRGDARELDRRIVQVLMGPPQAVNRREHRPARAQMPLAQRIANLGDAIVRVEKCEQRIELHRRAFCVGQRAQFLGGGDSRLRRLPSLEGPQVLDAAEIPFVAERTIQGRDIRSPYRRAVDREREMGRTEQRDDRLAREVRCDELEHQIERSRIRLCRQRQRIEGLIRNAGIREHIPREIHVRQRTLEHHRPAIEIRRPGRLDGRRDR